MSFEFVAYSIGFSGYFSRVLELFLIFHEPSGRSTSLIAVVNVEKIKVTENSVH